MKDFNVWNDRQDSPETMTLVRFGYAPGFLICKGHATTWASKGPMWFAGKKTIPWNDDTSGGAA